MKNFSIIPGTPVIISGDQGTGKTTLAINAARSFGSYVHSTMQELRTSADASHLLASEPDTVIVEDFEPTTQQLDEARQMATAKLITLRDPDCPEGRDIKTPNFIFVTQHKDMLKAGYDHRRFMIIEL